jgi:hypothetical protein
MKKQLRVTKADGTDEVYMHTKVIGTINSALTAVDQADMLFAEDLAEVVTFYLYNKWGRRGVHSNEIYAMIKAVLVATGHEEAASALSQHAIERRLRRSRTEVLALDINEFADAQKLCETTRPPARCPWDKAQIVHDLTSRFGLPPHTARAVASSVEERILRLEMTTIPLSLIKQLVLGETVAMLRAEKELQSTSSPQPDPAADCLSR